MKININPNFCPTPVCDNISLINEYQTQFNTYSSHINDTKKDLF